MSNKLKDKIKKLPQKPGVYVFHDAKKKILYVGKAKNLRSRVRSYFAKSAELTAAKQLMVRKINSLDYTIVDNETEALLLETNLIKKHHPPYNIFLKDDKYWQYIKIDYSATWPTIYSIRRPDFKKNKQATYFGPYTSSAAVKEALRQIKKLFPICLNLPQRPGQRPRACFNHHLGRCLGPCVDQIKPPAYAKLFDDVKKFITGSRNELIKRLKRAMLDFSQHKHFEAAARVRDQLKALEKLEQRQKIVSTKNENVDLLSLYQQDNQIAVNLFKIRTGKLIDKFNTLLKAPNNSPEDAALAFAELYYAVAAELPRTILTRYKLPAQTLLNIRIQQVQRGRKLQLIKLGEANAREYLLSQETFFEKASKKSEAALIELKKILRLKSKPQRIEAYDIANVQGVSAVGGMVVFESGQAKKTDYRKFAIKTIKSANDPGMMAEMLGRRLRHKSWPRPDLIVLDGGKGQLSEVIKIIKKLRNSSLPVVALAKREEDIYVAGRKNQLKLSKRSPALQLLQQIRDEVHRYANSFFQKKHARQSFTSLLDSIPGIGPKTKNLLKKKYGSLTKISQVPASELAGLIGPQKTKLIKERLGK